MANLFTYNSFNHNIRRGLPLQMGRRNPKNPMQIMRPHLLCGERFIALNTRWQHPTFQAGMLMRASLETIEPVDKKPFTVFNRAVDGDDSTLVFVETTPPAGYTPRVDINELNAYTGVVGEGVDVVVRDIYTGQALVKMVEGATAYVFLPDGRVERLVVSNHEARYLPLSQREMAQHRVQQFEEQFAANLDTVSRQHGIIGGALRLVKAVKDADALDVLVDFLIDKQAAMTDGLRKQVRYALLDAGHPAASNFLDGYEAINVVRIQKPEAAAARAKAEQKRRERSAADRNRTDAAKERASKSRGEGDITQQSNGRGAQKANGKKK